MMDTVKRLMAGRSAVVERSIDKAVDYLGRSSESLKRQAETAKAKARELDPEHPDGSPTGGPAASAPPTSSPPAPGVPPSVPLATPAPPPPPPPPAAPPSGAPGGGSVLRGDLAEPPEVPPAG